MRIDKKRASTLFALTLLVTSLLLVNIIVPVETQAGTKYLHEIGGLTTLHLDAKAGLISLTSPNNTLWHQLYPSFCVGDYSLTRWNDTNGDGMLGWCDQIALMFLPTQKTLYYHVERVMATLNLTRESDQRRMYVEYWGKQPFWYPINNPVCTMWHEVYPVWCNMYHITAWPVDSPPINELSFCDYIDMVNMSSVPPGPAGTWHVEKVSTDMIVTQKNTEPESTHWRELYPEYPNSYTLTDWDDNHDAELSPCDNITLMDESQESALYHVDEVTVTLNITLLTEPTHWIMIEFIGHCLYDNFWDPPLVNPLGTSWHEVYPQFCPTFTLSSWMDNGDGILSKCDTIDMTNETGDVQDWHVEEVSKDITVTEIVQPPTTPPMYWKPGYPDYAPSGMPDFNQRQDGWNPTGQWTWCAPTAVANSLWWLDSKFDPSNLVTNFTAGIDDHDPKNVIPFITRLAYLMDTDAIRTTPGGGAAHTGTWTWDMETGIAQYLSWTGVNPQGDVNGDGKVNATDLAIVTAANGTSPGAPGWRMDADIWPATTGWPTPTFADNKVDNNDINLVKNNMNQTGSFYERTLIAPRFDEVEREVERCEDVVLVIGFWMWDGEKWVRESYPYLVGSGHAVTVAGINSTSLKIAVSDPDNDAFHDGLITQGRVPVAHPPYPHNSTIHNNASLVSQDIYDVAWAPPGVAGNFTLVGYPKPGRIAVVEAAVITSPLELEVCGVDITNVTVTHCTLDTLVNGTFKTWTLKVKVTVHNNGTVRLNCTVRAYYYNTTNTYQIGTAQNITNLPPCNSITLTFNLNSTLLYVGVTYTVKANATCPCGASDEFVNGHLTRRKWGDIGPAPNGDGKVGLGDVGKLDLVFSNYSQGPYIDPYCDITGDCYVKLGDVGKLDLIYSGWFTDEDC